LSWLLYAETMIKRWRLLAISTGSLAALGGAAVAVVYLFQPWRSCSYDDSPAACAMLPGDSAVMVAALAATIIGLLVAVGAATLIRPTSP
jgi:hypothetical protein